MAWGTRFKRGAGAPAWHPTLSPASPSACPPTSRTSSSPSNGASGEESSGAHLRGSLRGASCATGWRTVDRAASGARGMRSEEHTSELQSLAYLVCRLLLEKKKKKL